MAVPLFNPVRNRKGVFKRGVEMLLRAFSATRGEGVACFPKLIT